MTYVMPAVNTVYNVNALDLLASMPDGSVDCVLTDPPYGLNLEKWDTETDIENTVREFARVLKEPGFLAFTTLAPYDIKWRLAAGESGLKFVDHVVWLKRNTGAYSAGLCHAHESLYIYRKGAARYYENKGRYSDVKVPGLMFDAISTEGLQRYIDTLWSYVHTGKVTPNGGGRRHVAHFRRGAFASSRIPEHANFTTVWSFLPEHYTSGKNDNTSTHASVKPLLMFQRIVELLTAPGALIVDPFAGSGTTAVAARNLGRDYIVGDLSAEYVAIARQRLAEPFTPSFLHMLEAQEAS